LLPEAAAVPETAVLAVVMKLPICLAGETPDFIILLIDAREDRVVPVSSFSESLIAFYKISSPVGPFLTSS